MYVCQYVGRNLFQSLCLHLEGVVGDKASSTKKVFLPSIPVSHVVNRGESIGNAQVYC